VQCGPRPPLQLRPFSGLLASLTLLGIEPFCLALSCPAALQQGQDTDPDAVAEIRDAVRNGSEASVRLLNYKKSGKPFWNMFTLAPMADVDGNLRFIIGVQVKF
jgi:PAS domain